jgi:hypothetical protein
VPLTVAPAQFEKKKPKAATGDGAGAKKRAKRSGGGGGSGGASLSKEEQVARIRAMEQRAALSWAEEGDESLGLHVVVLKGLFDPPLTGACV